MEDLKIIIFIRHAPKQYENMERIPYLDPAIHKNISKRKIKKVQDILDKYQFETKTLWICSPFRRTLDTCTLFKKKDECFVSYLKFSEYLGNQDPNQIAEIPHNKLVKEVEKISKEDLINLANENVKDFERRINSGVDNLFNIIESKERNKLIVCTHGFVIQKVLQTLKNNKNLNYYPDFLGGFTVSYNQKDPLLLTFEFF